MQSREIGVHVLSVPVASCDRRALSDAWFSALHLHRSDVRAPDVQRTSRSIGRECHTRAATETASRPVGLAAGLQRATRSTPFVLRGGTLPLRQIASHATLAQRITRTFFERKPHPKQASFVIGGGPARIVVLVRATGRSTQIVALCPPAGRREVARALAEVQAALTRRGSQVRSRLCEVNR